MKKPIMCISVSGMLAAAAILMTGCVNYEGSSAGSKMEAEATIAGTEFILTVKNVGTEEGMVLQDGSTQSPLLSWGVFAVHRGPNPLYTPGEPASDTGLEALAENGSVDQMAEWLTAQSGLVESGVIKAERVDGLPLLFPGTEMSAPHRSRPG